MATYIKKDEAIKVEFEHKPIWRDRWEFQQTFVGSGILTIGQGRIQQRFTLPDNKGKAITLFCPWITAEQLETLMSLINYDAGALTLKPEDAETTYQVIFRANNPIEIAKVGGDFPDEDKKTVGDPYNRYSAILHLIAVS